MAKYEISALYTTVKYCGEVEAENMEEAIDKAYELGLIEHSIGLCWHCSQKLDDLYLDDEYIFADKIE